MLPAPDGALSLQECRNYLVGIVYPIQTFLTPDHRTAVTLVVITLDVCGRTFGTAPCSAVGTPCYNTWQTCRLQSAFLLRSREYRFSSADSSLIFRQGERPYLKGMTILPTEIKDSLTVSSRITLDLYDEPDGDVGMDPYLDQRPQPATGTFWKKLLARNPHYQGRRVDIYQGILGPQDNTYRPLFCGTIDRITLGRGTVKIEVVDQLKSLAQIEVPAKVNITLAAATGAADGEISLSSLEGLDTPAGCIRVGDELLSYSGVNQVSKHLTGCARGIFGTVAAAHNAQDKVQKARYFAPANPFDQLLQMLTVDGGLAAEEIDTPAFQYWRDWPGGEPDLYAVVSETQKLDKLFFELVDLLDCRVWVNEDMRVTLRRNMGDPPGAGGRALTDEAHIKHDSSTVDLNDRARLSRAVLYWDKTILGKDGEENSYLRRDLSIDADAESENAYGTPAEKKIFCRWIHSDTATEETLALWVRNLLRRIVVRQVTPPPLLSIEVEHKDADVRTGEILQVTTNEMLEPDGTPLAAIPMMVVRREQKSEGVHLQLQRQRLRGNLLIAPNTFPDLWSTATPEQQAYGCIGENDGTVAGKPGFTIL